MNLFEFFKALKLRYLSSVLQNFDPDKSCCLLFTSKKFEKQTNLTDLAFCVKVLNHLRYIFLEIERCEA